MSINTSTSYSSLSPVCPQQLEAMKAENNLYGEAMALDNVARTYEYMANMSKACEALEAVSL